MPSASPVRLSDNRAIEYTTVDLNDASAQTVYAPSAPAVVSGVWLPNSGSAAEVQLQVTDGSSTADITALQAAGDPLRYTDTIYLSSSDSLVVDVGTAEGSAETGTCGVSRSERST